MHLGSQCKISFNWRDSTPGGTGSNDLNNNKKDTGQPPISVLFFPLKINVSKLQKMALITVKYPAGLSTLFHAPHFFHLGTFWWPTSGPRPLGWRTWPRSTASGSSWWTPPGATRSTRRSSWPMPPSSPATPLSSNFQSRLVFYY